MRFVRRLGVIFAAGLALAVLTAPALASTQPASGTFTEGPETITGEREADGNFIIELT